MAELSRRYKIVLAPDSFKESLSAVKAADAMEKGLLRVSNSLDIMKIPMADGGEGTVEALLTAVGGDLIKGLVTGPMVVPVDGFIGMLSSHKTAVIEMAAASGIALIPAENRNPLKATSFGTGELIRMALDEGAERIIIGIGGSATNDGGMGMLQALGVKFFDEFGNPLGLGGGELLKLYDMDISCLDKRINDVEIVAACDVKNPLCGPEGASEVFGPQKGASPEMVTVLDLGLEQYADLIEEKLKIDIRNVPGSGAAGGMGAGLMAFLGAKLVPGMEIIADLSGLEEKIKQADLVLTGEGNTDAQTLYGKVPFSTAVMAKKHNVPVICLSGGLGSGIERLYEAGITAAFSIVNRPMSLEEAFKKAAELLSEAAENSLRLWLSQRPMPK